MIDANVDRHRLSERHPRREAARRRRRPGSTASRSSSRTWSASPASPEEVAALARRLGLSLDLYQPFRDAEGVTERRVRAACCTARAPSSRLMQRLGIDTMLVCSNVGTATIDDDEVSAAQLRRLGEEAAAYGVRLAYEALAWGRYVDDYRRAWRIVELADHPAVGVCLDSFHILSRGHDPAEIEQIPGDKIFFLQLADAPALTMDVLSWSRHHRLFPGEGAFDLAAFVGHVLARRVRRPDVARGLQRRLPADRRACAPRDQAKRSLTWLEDQVAHLRAPAGSADQPVRLPEVGQPAAFDFVEVKAEDTGEVDVLLGQLGFTFRGRHRSKPVRLWTQGRARVVCNEQLARDVGADAGRRRLRGRGRRAASAARARRARGADRLPPYPRQRAGARRRSGRPTAPRSSSPDVADRRRRLGAGVRGRRREPRRPAR